MGNRILNLIFKADTRDADTKLRSLSSAQKQLVLDFRGDAEEARKEYARLTGTSGDAETGQGGTGLLGSISAAQAVGASLLGVGVVLKKELGNYTDYIEGVRDLSASLNITVEEASYLFDAMDQSDISTTTMIAAFQRMTKEGIEPTLGNLQDLLTEYDTLNGIDKSAFANEMFGPAGVAQIIPWWEQLTELQKERLGYQETGLAVTQKMVDEAKELETATSLVNTEWENIKGMLAEEVLPLLTTMAQYIYISMEYSRRMRDYLSGLKVPSVGSGQNIPGIPGVYVPIQPDPSTPSTQSIRRESYGPGDNQALAAEVKNLVENLPVILKDAVERR